MDAPTPSEFDATGSLPAAGAGDVPPPPAERRPEPPAWLAEARAGLALPGRYLAYEQDGRSVVVALRDPSTRIGRSLGADVRFDDTTVSRRHALIAVEDGRARILDDRSRNGVSVNGRRVEASPLEDGDEIAVGRYRLYFLDAATVAAEVPVPVAVAE